MATTLDEKIRSLSPARRRKVEARAQELIAEELSLRDLRKARARTQAAVAKKLGVGQEGVSRLEQRSDLMLSTLRNYVEAMGGELNLIAQFPDRPPVRLQGLAVMAQSGKLVRPSTAKRTSKPGLAEEPAKPLRRPGRRPKRP